LRPYGAGNELYMFLSVSFIQMMKSLSPIVVLFLLVFFGMDSLTWPKLGGVVLMTIGMIIACYTEPLFNVKGIVLMFVGEAAEAMRMVFFQHLLGAQQFGGGATPCKLNPWGFTALAFSAY
jgi:drug/metabolite transporter (DMT)-like permease